MRHGDHDEARLFLLVDHAIGIPAEPALPAICIGAREKVGMALHAL